MACCIFEFFPARPNPTIEILPQDTIIILKYLDQGQSNAEHPFEPEIKPEKIIKSFNVPWFCLAPYSLYFRSYFISMTTLFPAMIHRDEIGRHNFKTNFLLPLNCKLPIKFGFCSRSCILITCLCCIAKECIFAASNVNSAKRATMYY